MLIYIMLIKLFTNIYVFKFISQHIAGKTDEPNWLNFLGNLIFQNSTFYLSNFEFFDSTVNAGYFSYLVIIQSKLTIPRLRIFSESVDILRLAELQIPLIFGHAASWLEIQSCQACRIAETSHIRACIRGGVLSFNILILVCLFQGYNARKVISEVYAVYCLWAVM